MNKILGILILIILSFALYQNMSNRINNGITSYTHKYNKIMKYDLENKYPDTPVAVISIFSETLEYLYGEEVESEKIKDVVYVQRKLLDSEVLITNPENVQFERVKLEVEEMKKEGIKVIQNKIMSEIIKGDNNIVSIKVVQYTNKKGNNYLKYYLRKDNAERWKILGWENVEPFEIIE